MEFILTAYCNTVPFLLALTLLGKQNSISFFRNVLSVSNLLLIGYSIFLVRQLISLYRLGKQFHQVKTIDYFDADTIRLILVIVLPFLALTGRFRKNRLFSVVLLVLLYWTMPPFTWNTYDLFSKIPSYGCLLCSAYALLWLLNLLPNQSKTV